MYSAIAFLRLCQLIIAPPEFLDDITGIDGSGRALSAVIFFGGTTLSFIHIKTSKQSYYTRIRCHFATKMVAVNAPCTSILLKWREDARSHSAHPSGRDHGLCPLSDLCKTTMPMLGRFPWLLRERKSDEGKGAARPKVVKPASKSAISRSDRSKSTASNLSPPVQTRSLDDLIVAGAHALALTVDLAWKPAVRANLQVIFAQATLFTTFELPDDAEPAPIFKA